MMLRGPRATALRVLRGCLNRAPIDPCRVLIEAE
jgi:hypothetical protein